VAYDGGIIVHTPSAAPKGRGRWIAAALALALIAAFGIWWWGGALARREDPRVAEVRAMHEEMAVKFPPGKPIRSPDEAVARVTAMQAVIQKVQSLPPQLRGPAMMSGAKTFRASIDAKVDEFFTLPANRRAAFLDVEINQMEMMRSAFGAEGSPPSGGPAPGAAAGNSSDRRPPFPPLNLSESEAASMRKNMLDETSPERRARMEEFIAAMQNRRSERGLPAFPEPP
jgi:hypothetical protein